MDLNQFVKQCAVQIGAGGSAGFVEVCIMHPLDLVKTRLQLQATTNIRGMEEVRKKTHLYNGVFDCFKKMYKTEGVFSFWKGIVPPIMAETPKRAVKFFTFEQYKQLFTINKQITPFTYSMAGLLAGITEGILVNPFEVVKVQLQANKLKSNEMPSTWFITKEIIKSNGFGLSGLNKGLVATLLRNGTFNMIYFGFYHSVKDLLPIYEGKVEEFAKKVGIGFVSGTLASCLNIQFDVVKSRIQGPQPIPNRIKYDTIRNTFLLIYKEEGFLAFYKGLLPKIMRLGPGGAIMLVVYDYMHQYLTESLLL